jgi:predicted 3-demethylubiquinone-9 3-methyltransferase (glyoxalase superfamily)
MSKLQTIAPCLWFDSEAEDAAKFYTSIFPNSKITSVNRYTEVGKEFHGKEPGSVMTVVFELDGTPFTGLNGGPIFTFNESISFQISCDTQEEIDHFWNRLGEGGDARAQQCGWLKDRFGLSWQVIPSNMDRFFSGPDSGANDRAMQAMFGMKKIVIADLERAREGSPVAG